MKEAHYFDKLYLLTFFSKLETGSEYVEIFPFSAIRHVECNGLKYKVRRSLL